MSQSSPVSTLSLPGHDFADWFGLLTEAGVATMRTQIVRTDLDLRVLLHGERPEGFDAFLAEIASAAAAIGFPAFLRTGYGAAKEQWAKTCFLRRPEDIENHIRALVAWSAAQPCGTLPTDTWVIRELLPLRPQFIAYEGMPVVAERRYYFNALGQVIGHHPLATEALIGPGNPRGPKGPLTETEWKTALANLNTETPEEIAHLTALTEQIGQRIVGDWAADWLRIDGGWVLVDLNHTDKTWVDHDHPTAPSRFGQYGPLDDEPRQQGLPRVPALAAR